MSARTVAVRLTAEVGSYVTGMKNATRATKDLASSTIETAGKNKKAFTTAGIAAGAFGTAAAAGVGLAVKRFADFDQAMSGVQAATHESAAAMGDLRAAALEAGARTVFSASEAADAIEQLAKAGVSTKDILGGGLSGALDLAAAGSLAVGDAAEIAATAMTQFKLNGAVVPHIADLLAAGAGKAQGEVTDLAQALKQSGLVASQMGLSVEETTGTLAAFASAGLLGSDAGTSFRTMLLRLTNPTDEAADLMKDLGIEVYDAQGQFVGMQTLAGELSTQMGALAPATRNAALATIFGSDAIRAANVLYSQGARGVADWTKKVDDAGYAQETAAIKLNNLKGDIEAFSGSVETAFIKSGSAANGFLRGIVQGATDVVNTYSGLPGAVQTGVTALGGLGAAAGIAGSGFLLLAPRIAETREAMRTLSTEMPRTTAAMRGLGRAAALGAVLGTVTLGIDALLDAASDGGPKLNALTDSLADFLAAGAATGALARVVGENFEELAHKLKLVNENQLVEGVLKGGFGDSIIDIRSARHEIDGLDKSLATLVTSGHGDQARQIFATIRQNAGDISDTDLAKTFDDYNEAVAGASAASKLGAGAQKELGAAAGATAGKVDTEAKSLSELEKELRDVTGLVLGLRDAQRGYEQALDDLDAARVKNGKTLDIHTQKGRDNAAALDAVANAGNDVLQGMIDSGRPYDEINAKLRTQRDVLVAAAMKFGVTKEEARKYAESVLKIPPSATTEVKAPGLDKIKIDLKAVQDYMRGIDGSVATATVIVNGVNTAAGAAGKQDRDTHAAGGWIRGPGGPRDDVIPAYLSNGEFVVNAGAAARNASLLEQINRGFADGGWVSGRPSASAPSVVEVGRTPLIGQVTFAGTSRDDRALAVHDLTDLAFRLAG